MAVPHSPLRVPPQQDLYGQQSLQPCPPAPISAEPSGACRELSGPIMTHTVISPFEPGKKKT